MNFIKEVKQRVDIVKVAEQYGIQLDRTNKCRCPFHREKTASFSISQSKQIFKCFGCGKGGDVITLIAELLNVNSYEAAKSINDNMRLGLDYVKSNVIEINQYKSKQNAEKSFEQWEHQTFQLLCDYFHLLCEWDNLKNPNSELYIEALHNKNYIDYLIDEIFIYGNIEDKVWFYKNNKKLVTKIKGKLSTLKIK